jgi:hypothetical protein
MSTTPLLLLDYAGPAPASMRPSLLTRCWRLACALVIFTLVTAVVIVRTALLVSGVACLFAGTLLLTLGGHRDAGQRLNRWRVRAADLLHLWASDIARPFRGTWRSLFRRRGLAQ